MKEPQVRAFEVSIYGESAILFKTSAAKAKARAMSSYQDMRGKRDTDWLRLRCKRRPDLDALAGKNLADVRYNEQKLKGCET